MPFGRQSARRKEKSMKNRLNIRWLKVPLAFVIIFTLLFSPFSTLPILSADHPIVSTLDASNIRFNSATLNGRLDDNATAPLVYLFFEYGLTTTYGETTPIQNISNPDNGTNFHTDINGLSPGKTYHFRAVVYTSTDIHFPGNDQSFVTNTLDPVVVTTPATNITRNMAVLNASLIDIGTSSSVSVYFEYGIDRSYGLTASSQILILPGTVSILVQNLTPGTTYHYRAVAVGNLPGATVYGADLTFTTNPVPIVVATMAAENITTVSARLWGHIYSLGSAASIKVSFLYSPTSTYSNATSEQIISTSGDVSEIINNLAPGTTYHFQIKADGGTLGTFYGMDGTFTTLTIPPAVETQSATGVSYTTAILNGFLDTNGTADQVDVFFKWGLDNNTGNSTGIQQMRTPGSFSFVLNGLSPGQIYYFRAEAQGGIHGTSIGALQSFVTPTITGPQVVTSDPSSPGYDNVTLNGSLIVQGTAAEVEVYFEYGPTTDYGSCTTYQRLESAGDFNTGLTGLTPGATYHYRAVATAGIHGQSIGDDKQFTMQIAPGPQIFTGEASALNYDRATLNGELLLTGSSTSEKIYFEYGLSTAYGNTSDNLTMNISGPFSIDISGLIPGTIYHFRAVAQDNMSGLTMGEDHTFSTLTPPGVITQPATNIRFSNVTLNGTLTNMETSAPVTVYFRYALAEYFDTNHDYSNSTPTQTQTTAGNFSADITGLVPGEIYHFRAIIIGGASGTYYGEDKIFTTLTLAPVVSTGAATAISRNTATLNGYLIETGTSGTVVVWFQYGTSNLYGKVTDNVANLSNSGPFTYSLNGLGPGTTYHYRAVASGTNGTANGEDMTFTTQPIPIVIVSQNADNIGTTSARLHGRMYSLGASSSVNVSFEYGTSTDYGLITAPEQNFSLPGEISFDLNSLSPGVTYHYRIKADGGAQGTAYGLDMTFATSVVAPVVSTSGSQVVDYKNIILRGNLSSLGTASSVVVYFEYGTTTVYGNTSSPLKLTESADFSLNINGLTPATQYHFRAKVDGGIHGTTYGPDMTFTSLTVTTPQVSTLPVLSAEIGYYSAVLNGNLITMGTAGEVTVFFEYGSTIAYGSRSDNLTLSTPGAFHINLNNLQMGLTFHIRAVADGGTHGKAYGGDVSFSTISKPVVSTDPATNVSFNTATINGTLYTLGVAQTVNVFFKYDTDTVYGYTTAMQSLSAPGHFSVNLSGLQSNKTYHFIAYAVDAANNSESGIATGVDLYFTTLITIPPEVSTSPADSITPDCAKLHGFLDSRGTASIVDVSFEYGLTSDYGNVSDTLAMSSAGAFGITIDDLLPNTTYHYRALANGHDTVTGADMTFKTANAPPVVTTENYANLSSTSITLQGKLNSLGSDSVYVSFEYGMTIAYGNTTSPVPASSPGPFSAIVNNLAPDTTYHYRARASGSYTAYGVDRTFTTSARPQVTTDNITDLSYFSATLNGSLTSMGIANRVKVFFKYDLTSIYGNAAAYTFLSSPGSFSYTLTGLQPNTTYHFIAYAVDADNNSESGIATGIDLAFTTLATSPPEVSTAPASDASSSDIQLNGFLDLCGTASSVSVYFEYGLTADYGFSSPVTLRNSAGSFENIITGLMPNTTYHYRARAAGHDSVFGADMSFKTTTAPPLVSTDVCSNITTTSVTLNGTLSSLGADAVSVSFEYGLTSSYGFSTPPVSMSAAGPFSAQISNLAPNTTYHYCAKASGSVIVYGSDLIFTTSSKPEVFTSAASNVSYFSATLKGNLNSKGIANNVKVFFKYDLTSTYGHATTYQLLSLRGAFSADINGLQPDTTYHFIAYAVDADNNSENGIATGLDLTFTTLATTTPEVSTAPASVITATTTVLNGFLDLRGSASNVDVSFEYGLTSAYGFSSSVSTLSSAGAFVIPISGLAPNTTYHFRTKAIGHGSVYGADQFFTTLPVPPVVSTLSAVDISYDQATLKGRLESMGASNDVQVAFEYGLSISYDNVTEAQALSETTEFSILINGLLPNTTYRFRAIASNQTQGAALPGQDLFFTTLAVTSPDVHSLTVSGLGYNQVILKGNLNSLGTATAVYVSFDYGSTSAYGLATTTRKMTAPGDINMQVSNLDPGTKYYFRIKADGDLHGIGYGENMTFTTLSVSLPQVTTLNATIVDYDNASLAGNLTSLGSSGTVEVSFEYGLTNSYGSSTPAQAITTGGIYYFNVNALTPGQTYHYRAKADAGLHGTGYGSDLTFTTLPVNPPQVLTGELVITGYDNATLSGYLSSLGTANLVNVSFDYGPTSAYNRHSQTVTMTTKGNFNIEVNGLLPNTQYHFRAVADAGIHGIVRGLDMTFNTLIPATPVITSNPASGIMYHNAVLNANLVATGNASSIKMSFEYGTTSSYGQTTAVQVLGIAGSYSAAIYNLNAGSTYHFRAKADAGVMGIIYGSDTTFTTLMLPSVNTLKAANITATSVTLNGHLLSLGSAITVNVFFEYGTTPAYGNATTIQKLSASGSGDFSLEVNSLSPDTLYYFRASVDAGMDGSASGAGLTFSTLTPPTVGTPQATNVTITSATLNGDITSMGSATQVQAYFEYGTSTSYGENTTSQLMLQPGPFSADISGLQPGTTYHFREKADGGPAGIGYGPDVVFTTMSIPPMTSTLPATEINTNSTVLNGNLAAMGTAASIMISFEYGLTTSYGQSTSGQSVNNPGLVSTSLSGLSPGTIYHFRIKADGANQGVAYGWDQTFTTSTAPPQVETRPVYSISSGAVNLFGYLSSMGTATSVDVYFEYGQNTSYGNITLTQTLIQNGAFSLNITGLAPGHIYHFRARANGGMHGSTFGADKVFTTAIANSIPPQVNTQAASSIVTNSAVLNGILSSLGSSENVTVAFEYGSSSDYGYRSENAIRNSTGLYSFTLNSLQPGTLYHYRALAEGGDNGTAAGQDQIFITGTTPPLAETYSASLISSGSAVINGYVSSLGTAKLVNVYFEYSKTTAYSNSSTPLSLDQAAGYSVLLTNLSPGTQYHYRIHADGGIHGSTNGSDRMFYTAAAGTTPPGVSTMGISDITTHSAHLTGHLDTLGSASSVTAGFEYGTTSSFGSVSADQHLSAMGDFSLDLDNLQPGTIYHFRALAGGSNSGLSAGVEMIFTTSYIAPAVDTLAANPVGAHSARLNAFLSNLGTASEVNLTFHYGLSTSIENSTPSQLQSKVGFCNTLLENLTPSTRYYFQVIVNGGIHGTYQGPLMTFVTAADNTATPQVSTSVAQAITSTSAQLGGNLISTGSAQSVSVYVEYGVTEGYGFSTSVQTMSSSGNFSFQVDNLKPATTYHFRATVNGGDNGTSCGSDLTFITSKLAPSVITAPATATTAVSATLNGVLDVLGSALAVNVYFDFGTTTDYGNSLVLPAMTAKGPFSLVMVNLTPSTEYHFRTRAEGGEHGSSTGSDVTFMTAASGTTPPIVVTKEANLISPTAVQVMGELTSTGTNKTVKVWMQYGLTDVYGMTTSQTTLNSTQSFSFSLDNLIPGTIYHYRALADAETSGSAYGQDMVFTTPVIAPTVSTLRATTISYNSATLNGNLSSLGTAKTVDAYFKFGTTSQYDNSTARVQLTSTGLFSINLIGLSPATTYHYQALADGAISGLAHGGDFSFITAQDNTSRPAVVSLATTSTNSTGGVLNGRLTGLGSANQVQVGFEYGPSAAYGLYTSIQTENSTGLFSVSISGLNPGSTYHYRALAMGDINGSAEGVDIIFSTNNSASGGGGGSSSATPTPTPTPVTFINGTDSADVSKVISKDGLISVPVTLTSQDGVAVLNLNKETTALNADGSAIKSLSIRSVQTAGMTRPQDNSTVATTGYNLEPSGAIFKPSITLTLHYNPADFPDNASPYVAYFDTLLNKWTSLKDPVVNNENHTIMVQLTHFTTFAVLARKATLPELSPTPTSTPTPTLTPTPSAIPSTTTTPLVRPSPSPSPTLTPNPSPNPTVTPTTPAEAKKGGVNIPWIIIIVVLLALVLAIIVYLRLRNRKTKAPVQLGEKSTPSKLYSGTVKLIIRMAPDSNQMPVLEEALRKSNVLRVESVGGSSEEGNVIIISIDKQKPIYLVDVLKGLTPVKQVVMENNRIVIILQDPE
jgi:phosphodiesterase/alkaline phosphatase D-like protein